MNRFNRFQTAYNEKPLKRLDPVLRDSVFTGLKPGVNESLKNQAEAKKHFSFPLAAQQFPHDEFGETCQRP
jgi:hypothetical protein